MATRFPIATIASDLASFRRAFEPFFDESVIPAQIRTLRSSVANSSARTALPLDVFANGDEIVVLAAVPGIDPEEIVISVEQNTVTMSGKIPSASEAEGAKDATWYLHELPRGSFKRTLQLPFDVDAQRTEATFEHGMLRLTLPKLESAKPRQIHIKVSGRSERAEPVEAGETSTPIAETATGSDETDKAATA